MSGGWRPASHRGKGPHFALVPHKLARSPDHGPHDVALYAVLRSYADFGEGTDSDYVGGAIPGSETLAEECGMKRKTVRAARDRLEEAGWISWFERPGRSHRYFLHNEPLTEEERRYWRKEREGLRKAWKEGGVDGLRAYLESRE